MKQIFKRKGGKTMCKKLKEIHDLKPSDVLNKYYSQEKHPIDVRTILAKMGIDCFSVDFAKLEKDLYLSGNDAILGIACSEGDDIKILYSNELGDADANYVLAHELAHCCLHLPVTADFHVELKTENDIYSPAFKRSIFKKSKENEADRFAASLLIPTDKLMEYLLEVGSPSIQTIAEYFSVPEHLARKKIDELKV